MKVSFRAECSHCGADLHVCVNCKNHALGKPNECKIPGTDPIRDREKANFCEEFQVKTDLEKNENADEALKRARRLFGLEE